MKLAELADIITPFVAVAALSAIARTDERRALELEEYAAGAGAFAFVGVGFGYRRLLPGVVAATGSAFSRSLRSAAGELDERRLDRRARDGDALYGGRRLYDRARAPRAGTDGDNLYGRRASDAR